MKTVTITGVYWEGENIRVTYEVALDTQPGFKKTGILIYPSNNLISLLSEAVTKAESVEGIVKGV